MRRPLTRTLRHVAATMVVAVAWSASETAPPTAEDANAVEHGRDLFRIYCATCHGPTGRGDGPTATALKRRPTDLTRLARRNGGAFPERTVWSAIDGRDDVLSHGTREMPIWGLAFQDPGRDVGQEDEVRARIGWLVAFLRSIQEPTGKGDRP